MSLKVGITGANGLIGWHVRAYLRVHMPQAEIRLAHRETFSESNALTAFVAGLDAIVHCAGMNRGDGHEVESCNAELAQRLSEACARNADAGYKFPHVVYTNSTHVERDTPYARGKRAAAAILAERAAQYNAPFANMILPHVFGEFGRPFYNSVVATFCHQLCIGEQPKIQVDSDLELVHAQDVAAEAIAAIKKGIDGQFRVTGASLKVSTLLGILSEMSAAYFERHVIPDLRDSLYLRLFNTLRSFQYVRSGATPLTLHQDNRGSLFEAVKTLNGGQAFLSTSHPGIVRGNHFHTHKFERFLVCSGEAEIHIRKLFSNEIRTFKVSGSSPCYVDMPTFHTHNIVNIGPSELVTMFWTNEIFDPSNPDTYSEVVQ